MLVLITRCCICSQYTLCCRKHWEDMSGKVHSFSPGSQAGVVQDSILRGARTLYGTLFSRVGDGDAKWNAKGDKGGGKGSNKHGNKSTGKRKLEEAAKGGGKRKQVDLSTVQCYKCREFGHLAYACPKKNT